MEPIEVRRERRFKRLWQASEAAGRPAPEPGTTKIKTTKEGRRFQRHLNLREIRKELLALPERQRPVVYRRGQDLILDYGIYQESYNLRSFVITCYGNSIGEIFRHAQRLAEQYGSSLVPVERESASVCRRVPDDLCKRMTNLEGGRGAVLCEHLTAEDAHSLIALGRSIEILERVAPRQAMALSGVRQTKRNRMNNSARSAAADELDEQRRQAVYLAMELQVRNRERLSFARAMKAAAVECGCSIETIKLAKPVNRWTPKKGEPK